MGLEFVVSVCSHDLGYGCDGLFEGECARDDVVYEFVNVFNVQFILHNLYVDVCEFV